MYAHNKATNNYKISIKNQFKKTYSYIDNICNDNEKNDSIMLETQTLIYTIINSVIYAKEERERRQRLFRNYKKRLHLATKTINKQIKAIDKLLADTNSPDFMKTFDEYQKEFLQLALDSYTLPISIVADYLDKDDLTISKNVYLYTLLDKYFNNFNNYCVSVAPNEIINIDNREANSYINQNNWKNYYYTFICSEKQNEINQIILKDHINQSNEKDKYSISLIKGDFYTTNFQAQISKTIYNQRKKQKLTQEQLSKLSNVDRTMIAKIEKLNQPTTLETAIKLLSALNMSVIVYPMETYSETSSK